MILDLRDKDHTKCYDILTSSKYFGHYRLHIKNVITKKLILAKIRSHSMYGFPINISEFTCGLVEEIDFGNGKEFEVTMRI